MFNREQIAALIVRVPFIATVLRFGVRLIQGRFSAGVVGVVLNERDEILIVEHVFHPNWAWGLPGGWLDRGESPAEGLRRELREETGLDIQVIRPLLVENGYYIRAHLDISYLCRTNDSSSITLSSELLSYRWITPDNLPRLLPFHVASIAAVQLSSDGKRLDIWE